MMIDRKEGKRVVCYVKGVAKSFVYYCKELRFYSKYDGRRVNFERLSLVVLCRNILSGARVKIDQLRVLKMFIEYAILC